MIPELGHLCLVIALCFSALLAWFGLAGPVTRNRTWMTATASLVNGQFLFSLLAFAALSYALRQAIPRQETAGRACAVLAIVGMINIPIIKYSVDWWLTLHQTSSISLTEAPNMPAEMWLPLVLNIVGIYFLLGANVLSRLRLDELKELVARFVFWLRVDRCVVRGCVQPLDDRTAMCRYCHGRRFRSYRRRSCCAFG